MTDKELLKKLDQIEDAINALHIHEALNMIKCLQIPLIQKIFDEKSQNSCNG